MRDAMPSAEMIVDDDGVAFLKCPLCEVAFFRGWRDQFTQGDADGIDGHKQAWFRFGEWATEHYETHYKKEHCLDG